MGDFEKSLWILTAGMGVIVAGYLWSFVAETPAEVVVSRILALSGVCLSMTGGIWGGRILRREELDQED